MVVLEKQRLVQGSGSSLSILYDQKEEKRPWWSYKRLQGLAIMGVGVAMLFHPVTAATAPLVIKAGASWTGVGTLKAVQRNNLQRRRP